MSHIRTVKEYLHSCNEPTITHMKNML